MADHGPRIGRDIPDDAECLSLLGAFRAGPEITAHCLAVADVAWRLTLALNDLGAGLDAPLVRAAALLHDLAKGRPDHAREGARILEGLGLPRVAAAMASHPDLLVPNDAPLSETELVYLADKLVQGDRIVSLEERFSTKLARSGPTAGDTARMEGRLARARRSLARVEAALGAPVASVLSRGGNP